MQGEGSFPEDDRGRSFAMLNNLKSAIRAKLLSPDRLGFDEDMQALFRFVKPYTLTSVERLFALWQGVEYVVKSKIPGDIVECGVWKGGSMMAAAHTLLKLGDTSRRLFLFDTFEGMTEPTDADRNFAGELASDLLTIRPNVRCLSPLEDVQRAMSLTGYSPDQISYVKGKVEETIPEHAPERIALLRLDTDLFESTYHELVHLYPRLSIGGVLIIDDYGHWKGARKAVDRYIGENKLKLLLNRIDYTGRMCVKIE